MKRLSEIEKRRNTRIAKRRLRSRVRRNHKKDRKPSRPKKEYHRILAPAQLSFKNNFDETVAFLDEFREHTVGKKAKRNVYVDLKPVNEISVPVAIVLAADFHRWAIVRRIKLRVRDHNLWDDDLRSLFSELGVFELLGVRGVKPELNEKHVTLTKLESGLVFDGRKIQHLQAQFREVLDGFMYQSSVYDGLTEAAENAISHGYPNNFTSRYESAGKRWWGASCLNLETMRLRFFIFDQGAGIPFTLPSVGWYERVRAILSNVGVAPNDTMVLRAALEVARTRTGQSHRGLGLNRMVEVVDGSETGYIRIISGKGEIQVHANGRIEETLLDSDIGGTLIEWNLPTDTFMETETA